MNPSRALCIIYAVSTALLMLSPIVYAQDATIYEEIDVLVSIGGGDADYAHNASDVNETNNLMSWEQMILSSGESGRIIGDYLAPSVFTAPNYGNASIETLFQIRNYDYLGGLQRLWLRLPWEWSTSVTGAQVNVSYNGAQKQYMDTGIYQNFTFGAVNSTDVHIQNFTMANNTYSFMYVLLNLPLYTEMVYRWNMSISVAPTHKPVVYVSPSLSDEYVIYESTWTDVESSRALPVLPSMEIMGTHYMDYGMAGMILPAGSQMVHTVLGDALATNDNVTLVIPFLNNFTGEVVLWDDTNAVIICKNTVAHGQRYILNSSTYTGAGTENIRLVINSTTNNTIWLWDSASPPMAWSDDIDKINGNNHYYLDGQRMGMVPYYALQIGGNGTWTNTKNPVNIITEIIWENKTVEINLRYRNIWTRISYALMDRVYDAWINTKEIRNEQSANVRAIAITPYVNAMKWAAHYIWDRYVPDDVKEQLKKAEEILADFYFELTDVLLDLTLDGWEILKGVRVKVYEWIQILIPVLREALSVMLQVARAGLIIALFWIIRTCIYIPGVALNLMATRGVWSMIDYVASIEQRVLTTATTIKGLIPGV